MSERLLGNVVVGLKAQDEVSAVIGKIQSAIGGITGMMSRMGGVMGDAGNIINSTFSGLATGGPAGAALGAGTALIGAATGAIQGCIKEATASEAVWASLGAAVERSGASWAALKSGTESGLLSMSKLTTYSDEELAAALEQLMSFGLSYDDAMKALGKTIDFSAAKHMDLGSAANVVAKAMKGNTALLKRYGVDVTTSAQASKALKEMQGRLTDALKLTGKTMDDPSFANFVDTLEAAGIQVEDTKGKLLPVQDVVDQLFGAFQDGTVDTDFMTDAFGGLGLKFDDTKLKAGSAEDVLGQLNAQFGGAAQNAANTYAGTQERLNNAWGEVKEKVGNIFLPALTKITEGMIPVVDKINEGIGAVTSWITKLGEKPEVKELVDTVKGAFQSIIDFMMGPDGLTVKIGEALGKIADSQAFKDIVAAIGSITGSVTSLVSALSKDLNPAFGRIEDIVGSCVADFSALFMGLSALFDLISGKAPDATGKLEAFGKWLRIIADYYAMFSDIQRVNLGRAYEDFVKFTTDLMDLIKGFIDSLIGHSVWPDFLENMQAQTTTGLSGIAREFASTFGDIGAMTSPIFGGPAMLDRAPGGGGAGVSPIVNVAASPVTVTTPIRLDMDGQTMYQVVEKRMVDSRRLGASW